MSLETFSRVNWLKRQKCLRFKNWRFFHWQGKRKVRKGWRYECSPKLDDLLVIIQTKRSKLCFFLQSGKNQLYIWKGVCEGVGITQWLYMHKDGQALEVLAEISTAAEDSHRMAAQWQLGTTYTVATVFVCWRPQDWRGKLLGHCSIPGGFWTWSDVLLNDTIFHFLKELSASKP